MATKTLLDSKHIAQPDERREMAHGVMEVVNLPGVSVTRATLEPGWRWSTDVAPTVGTRSCQVRHQGYIISGRIHVRMDDGAETELEPGDAFVIDPGHDAWVVGQQPCVNVDFSTTG